MKKIKVKISAGKIVRFGAMVGVVRGRYFNSDSKPVDGKWLVYNVGLTGARYLYRDLYLVDRSEMTIIGVTV